jgi:hypothetical protein
MPHICLAIQHNKGINPWRGEANLAAPRLRKREPGLNQRHGNLDFSVERSPIREASAGWCKGRIDVFVTVKGSPGHSSRPWDGINAVTARPRPFAAVQDRFEFTLAPRLLPDEDPETAFAEST